MMTPRLRSAFLCSLVAVLMITPQAAPAEQPAAQKGSLTNADVIELHRLALGDDVILEKIREAPTAFDVSLEGLKALKAAGISSAVIAEMVRSSRQAGAAQEAAQVAERDRNNPLAPQPGGIYYWEGGGDTGRLVMLEPTVYSQAKSGGFFKYAMTMGIAKMKSRAVLSGSRANLQIRETRPTFYLYFDAPNPAPAGAPPGYATAATSANEFLLVRTERKGNTRELVVGQMSAFGAQGGVMDKSVREFEFERLATGIYKVVPKNDLEPGEYCFFYAGSAPVATYGFAGPGGGGRVFDFGVQ